MYLSVMRLDNTMKLINKGESNESTNPRSW
jgi:hypothetical protein